MPARRGRRRVPARRRLPRLAALVALLAISGSIMPGVTAGPVARAQDPDTLRSSEAELRDELEGVRGQQEGIEEQLDEARRAREAVEADLTAATAQVDDLQTRIAEVRDDQAAIADEIRVLIAQSERARASLAAQVRELYMGGAGESFASLLDARRLSDVGIRSHYLAAMTRADRAQIEVYGNIETRLERRRADLAAADAQLQELEAQALEAQAELDRQLLLAAGLEAEVADRLADAEARARALEVEAATLARRAEEAEAAERAAAIAAAEEAARRAAEAREAADTQREAAAPPGAGAAPVNAAGMACPQAHPRSFTDTWGAPRGGGRSHQGTDIFGARGGEVYAITDGVVQFTKTGSRAGLFLSLAGNDGHVYWYMHLQDFVASPGQRVSAGQLIAHNGDTGNARGTTPHIHFEYHPHGGGPVNPYPLLVQVC